MSSRRYVDSPSLWRKSLSDFQDQVLDKQITVEEIKGAYLEPQTFKDLGMNGLHPAFCFPQNVTSNSLVSAITGSFIFTCIHSSWNETYICLILKY